MRCEAEVLTACHHFRSCGIVRRPGGFHCRAFSSSMMVSRKVVASLLVVYVVAMLAEQTEGYLAFFTRSDIERMQLQEKQRNKAQKKSLILQKRSEGGDITELSDMERVDEGKIIKLTAPGETGMRLDASQLEKYQHVLEELLTEMLLDARNGN
ncbi:promotilin isoform X1 [Gopherus evgoodei]|nr:promotilin isoform X1 [Gopherus evgoodei]XP_030417221.1 promotilin isoform X1 [Gopherus evgoodei]XP_030417222.1 promotilin isoform X1 [Gopherus evgoodei]XP_030417223.1 promotilin isoform X1 [Gopherus evgoodei]